MLNKKQIGIAILCLAFMCLWCLSVEVPKWKGIVTDQNKFSFMIVLAVLLYIVWIVGNLQNRK